MPRKTEPQSDLERSLFAEFEEQKQVRTAARRIAKAIEHLRPEQGEEALETVLMALSSTRKPQPEQEFPTT